MLGDRWPLPLDPPGAPNAVLGRFPALRRAILQAVVLTCKAKSVLTFGVCSREDSNLHGFPHTVLSRTRLPIPPREQNQWALTMRACQPPARSNPEITQ
jgi:hypothetical protein